MRFTSAVIFSINAFPFLVGTANGAMLIANSVAVPAASNAVNAPAASHAVDGSAAASTPDGCYWDGTAPFCAGSCPPGYTEENRGSCGDGACCWTGYKVYCCKD
ncbi:hypothetical protein HGRIS_013435 [Hohenbuehelia grisea]|uniref:Uncharacterized protein n=1 Tax=Hohenbuehelia grisea TaxID=104357 RepID=A0ABR3IVH0_9AGAR